MELIFVMRVLLRRWWIILVPVLIASALAIPDFIRNEQTGAGAFRHSLNIVRLKKRVILQPVMEIIKMSGWHLNLWSMPSQIGYVAAAFVQN